MKKFYLLCLSVCVFITASAQTEKCYTDQALINYQSESGPFGQRFSEYESIAREWIRNHQQHIRSVKRTSSVVTIPVVFHVVYKNANQNIADSNIYRQVAILNECFRLQNANFSQTRAIFDTIAADVEIEFCLASVDPMGNPTTGITRTQAPAGTFFDPLLGFDNVKSNATGGKDPWPSSQYLNIWICDMSFLGIVAVLGYATFPGGDPLKDGVVIQYQFTGFMLNNTTNTQGRTTVHEVGHWLGLRHIWGDGQLSAALCDSTDHVDDTPNADTASQQTCVIKNTCTNESPYWVNAGIDPPDMIENYMDYSYDQCMTMFTLGQKTRMLGFLNTVRASLLNSPGCSTTGLISHENGEPVQIYPNPARDKIFIIHPGNGLWKINFYDLTGRLFGSETIDTDGTVNSGHLSNGLWQYVIEKNGLPVKFGKLVKAD
jgi:hypothetical protein